MDINLDFTRPLFKKPVLPENGNLLTHLRKERKKKHLNSQAFTHYIMENMEEIQHKSTLERLIRNIIDEEIEKEKKWGIFYCCIRI